MADDNRSVSTRNSQYSELKGFVNGAPAPNGQDRAQELFRRAPTVEAMGGEKYALSRVGSSVDGTPTIIPRQGAPSQRPHSNAGDVHASTSRTNMDPPGSYAQSMGTSESLDAYPVQLVGLYDPATSQRLSARVYNADTSQIEHTQRFPVRSERSTRETELMLQRGREVLAAGRAEFAASEKVRLKAIDDQWHHDRQQRQDSKRQGSTTHASGGTGYGSNQSMQQPTFSQFQQHFPQLDSAFGGTSIAPPRLRGPPLPPYHPPPVRRSRDDRNDGSYVQPLPFQSTRGPESRYLEPTPSRASGYTEMTENGYDNRMGPQQYGSSHGSSRH